MKSVVHTDQWVSFMDGGHKPRKRVPGTIGMIVGGSVAAVSGGLYALNIPGQAGKYLSTGQNLEGSGIIIGTATFGVSGLVFIICKIAGIPRNRFSVSGGGNRVGVAYDL